MPRLPCLMEFDYHTGIQTSLRNSNHDTDVQTLHPVALMTDTVLDYSTTAVVAGLTFTHSSDSYIQLLNTDVEAPP